jgi:hypothetical protein
MLQNFIKFQPILSQLVPGKFIAEGFFVGTFVIGKFFAGEFSASDLFFGWAEHSSSKNSSLGTFFAGPFFD